MMKATIITPNVETQELQLEKKLTLEEMQTIVGGFIELVHTLDGREMLVDEEGKLKQLNTNAIASLLAGREIVGTALLLDYHMD